ncbi:hypothetical protein D3C80_1670960 [compost metagenome]
MAFNFLALETLQILFITMDATDVGNSRQIRAVQEKRVDVDTIALLRFDRPHHEIVFDALHSALSSRISAANLENRFCSQAIFNSSRKIRSSFVDRPSARDQ